MTPVAIPFHSNMGGPMAGQGMGGSSLIYPSRSATAPVMRNPNKYDDWLAEESYLFRAIEDRGGLFKVCCVSRYEYDSPPYLRMPPEGRQYQQIQSIPLPAADSTDYLVQSFRVPTGYDGVITSIAQFWTGAGFVEGSGDIKWRLKVGRAWVRNFGEVTTTLGNLKSPCPLFRGGIRVYSQQYVEYWVNHKLGSALTGGNIVTAVFGWYYGV